MASDSDSGHTGGSHSQDFSPMPGLSIDLPHQGTTNMSMGGTLSPASARKRPIVRADVPGIMKRSTSSPSVRDLAMLDTSGMSSAEKKRNKLGYHRTAVACVHCRRRKIRCILAVDDPTTRCHNCIRLKKDCQFYPVDQQPGPGKRATPSKNEESMNDSSTPEVSPAMTGTPWEGADGYAPGQFQSPAVPSESPGSFGFNGSMLHSENSGLSSASYSASKLYSQPPWSSTTPGPNSPSHSVEPHQFHASNSTHWHPQAQPGPSGYDFTPYPPTGMSTPSQSSTQENFPQYANSYAGEPQGWGQLPHHPVRSMSLASPHDLQGYHSPYHNDPHAFLQRHPTNLSEMKPTALSSNMNPTPPNSDTHSTSSAYPYSDHTQLSSSYHHSLAPLQSPSTAVTGSEAFGQHWYGAAAPSLADVREEEEQLANMQHQPMGGGGGRFRQNPG